MQSLKQTEDGRIDNTTWGFPKRLFLYNEIPLYLQNNDVLRIYQDPLITVGGNYKIRNVIGSLILQNIYFNK